MVLDGIIGLMSVCENIFDLVIFDFGLLDFDGVEVVWCLCKMSSVLIIIFMVMDVIDCKVNLFEVGVDDYMIKFFYFEEFVVCVKV